MKPSFLLAAALAAAVITLCASFSSGRGASLSKPSMTASVKAVAAQSVTASHTITPAMLKDNTHYYWYIYDGDVYDGWYTIAQEISRLENIYGVYVDGNPANGGYLISRGFILYGTPHLIWPTVLLYGH